MSVYPICSHMTGLHVWQPQPNVFKKTNSNYSSNSRTLKRSKLTDLGGMKCEIFALFWQNFGHIKLLLSVGFNIVSFLLLGVEFLSDVSVRPSDANMKEKWKKERNSNSTSLPLHIGLRRKWHYFIFVSFQLWSSAGSGACKSTMKLNGRQTCIFLYISVTFLAFDHC